MVLNFTEDKILVWKKQLYLLLPYFQHLLDTEPLRVPSKLQDQLILTPSAHYMLLC
jgi:hypothetical protein